jgi:formylmethanofuran dehydrogenase subunit A
MGGMIRLKGGRIIDPANGRDETGDLFIDRGRIVAPPADPEATETYDVSGRIVMAGAIDIHSHIAGANVNFSRLLLAREHPASEPHPGHLPLSTARWSTYETGRLYAQMGFTTVIEPAMNPQNALHAHLELADIPFIDKATLAVLGNEDFLLRLIRDGHGEALLDDYVAWSVTHAKALGVKVINAGGAAAFKENVRSFGLDDVVPSYGLSSRTILQALLASVQRLGIPHPLHVHCNNLGIAGSFVTAIETMEASGGLPMHMAHLQFYGYGTEGKRNFSSASAFLAEAITFHKNITIDVGQVMFGQTVTVSSDVLRQHESRLGSRPRKWIIWDGEGNGGGIVPYNYKATSYYNALQWAVGLELFLLIDDPWRVFFTTDHPNGAPFTAYPQVLHLLMSADERAAWIERLPKSAMTMSLLPQLKREYGLYEIAIMTRAAPARLLGLTDRGQLGVGAAADIAVYTEQDDKAAMFEAADYVFKDGELIVEHGRAKPYRWGRTHFLRPGHDGQIEDWLTRYYDRAYGAPIDLFDVPDRLSAADHRFEELKCRT